MRAAAEKLFLPGFGASGSLYRPGLPRDWAAIDPPGFRTGNGSLAASCRWLIAEIDRRRGPVALAGHSMGAALAIAAAAARPERITRLLLIAPAGLPLGKPLARSVGAFVCQVARGRYPAAEATRAAGAALRTPRRAVALARAVHDADLTAEMGEVRAAAIDTLVVGACGDSLVTTDHCRRTADLLGARYRELARGGHMWMLESWPELAALLDADARG
jgi:pimeloyl-ACP methyl ester carboxylesterase